jgi:hypothetical protein
MPKIEIDYSNTIIYKITCNDQNIKDVYVGHTTNFVQRKHAHKTSCINKKSANYKCKLYETIRSNNGWSNWKMEIINFFNCADHYEARKKEQEYFVSLNANLNSIEPLPKPKSKIQSIPMLEKTQKISIYCKTCNVYLQNTELLEIHNNTKKHIKLCNANNLIEKLNNKYSCEKCKMITNNKKDFNKHLSTSKHKNNHLINNNLTEISNTLTNITLIQCKHCNKKYSSRVGLWYHNKKFHTIDEQTTQNLEDEHSITQKYETIQPTNDEIIKIVKAQIHENNETRKFMIVQYNQMIELLSIITKQQHNFIPIQNLNTNKTDYL